MDQHEVNQSLLSDNHSADSPVTINGTKAFQRIRHRRNSGPDSACPKQNAVQLPLLNLEPIFEKQKFSFKLVSILLTTYLGIGTLCFYFVGDQIDGKKTNGLLDAIYFCVVTMTTVGYGDLVPRSSLAKLLSCVYVFIGMALVGLILSKAADYIVEKQEVLMAKVVHLYDKISPAEILKEVETYKVNYKFLMAAALLFILMVMGITFLMLVENMKFVDAFYCVCSTITTLGYGDESFSTGFGRGFAVVWILSSTICLAQFFYYLAELYTERRQRSLVNWVLTRKLTSTDLEEADLDHDKSVSPAEFVIYTLKEMGKISQEDISLAMERFKKLDVDFSGTLTEADLLSQSPRVHSK
ncbi:hypothetical protein ACFE04_029725 [Oxalis oulophora]